MPRSRIRLPSAAASGPLASWADHRPQATTLSSSCCTRAAPTPTSPPSAQVKSPPIWCRCPPPAPLHPRAPFPSLRTPPSSPHPPPLSSPVLLLPLSPHPKVAGVGRSILDGLSLSATRRCRHSRLQVASALSLGQPPPGLGTRPPSPFASNKRRACSLSSHASSVSAATGRSLLFVVAPAECFRGSRRGRSRIGFVSNGSRRCRKHRPPQPQPLCASASPLAFFSAPFLVSNAAARVSLHPWFSLAACRSPLDTSSALPYFLERFLHLSLARTRCPRRRANPITACLQRPRTLHTTGDLLT